MREGSSSRSRTRRNGEGRTLPFSGTADPRVADNAHSHSQAEHSEAERRLQEERAILTRFKAELRDLKEAIKAKKRAVVDAGVSIKNEVEALAKERAGHLTGAVNVERQHDWIEEENQWVRRCLSSPFLITYVMKSVSPAGIAV